MIGLAFSAFLLTASTSDGVVCCTGAGGCFDVATLQECVEALLPEALAIVDAEQLLADEQGVSPAELIDTLTPPRIDPLARLVLVDSCGEPYRPEGFSYDVLAG